MTSRNERTPLINPPPVHENLKDEDDSPMSPGDFKLLMTGLWTMTFVASLDGTVAATLTSSIGSDFSAMELSSWIGTAYLLSVCAFTPLYGRLCDIIGRRASCLLAGSLFGVGTMLCGVAGSMNQLLLFRTLAGMGGGGLAVTSSVIVSDLVPLKKRGLYQGFTNLLFGLGAGVGAPLGGYISDRFGWRTAFLMQSPILATSLVLLYLKIREPRSFLQGDKQLSNREKLRRIDYLGSLTLVCAIGCLLLGMSLKTSKGASFSDVKVWGLLIGSALSTLLFVYVELRVAAQPVLPFGILLQRTPAFVALNNGLLAVVSFSMLYNIPLYFTAVRLTSSGNAGAHLIPNSVALASGSLFSGWYMRKTGVYWRLTVFASLGPLLANVLLATWNDNTPEWVLYLTMVPSGFGMSSVLTTTLIAIISSVPRDQISIVTGISYLFRTAGQVLGVSLSSTLTQTLLERNLRATIVGKGSEQIVENILHSTKYISTLPPDLRHLASQSWASALRTVYIVQAVGAFLMLLAVLPIEENSLPDSVEEESQKVRRHDEEEED